jgi:hypothetical protein
MSSFPMGLPHLGSLDLPNAQTIQAALQAMGIVGTTGNVYFLDPVNGNDNTGTGSLQSPVASLGVGYALLVSGHNDVLVLIGNGASTGSARIHANFTWAKSAAHLVGICAPSAISQRARIATLGTDAAFANFFTVTGSGCLFQNLSFFHGFNAGVAAEICMTVTGARNAFVNCDFEGMGDTTGATDAGSRCILLSGAGASENLFKHCNIGLDTVERTNANASVEIKGGAPRNTFDDCTFLFWSSDGLQYGLLAAAVASMDRWVLFKSCNAIATVAGSGDAIAAFLHVVASAGGIVCFDSNSGLYNFTAIGDAASKAQTFVSGGTATNGVKGVVAT